MRRLMAALVAATVATATAAAVVVGSGHLANATQTPATASAKADHRPNIVMVLMDDASYELLATMRNARRMQAQGATYTNAHVVDSLCCPSRTSIFTGRPPHLTAVLTNTPQNDLDPIGGYRAFSRNGNAQRSFNVALQKSGYTTAFIGKYINGYDVPRSSTGHAMAPAKEPGWDEFGAVLSGGYPEWGFWSTQLNHRTGMLQIVRTQKPPRDSPLKVLDRHYATNVMADRALEFLASRERSSKPYFLEVAAYGPHAQMHHAYRDNPPFPSAFADRAPKGDPTGGNCGKPCASLTLRDLKGYDDPRRDNTPTYLRHGRTSPAPAWNTNPVVLDRQGALERYRDRARMVQSIDRMLGRIRAAVGPDTYVFFTSDNGFHLGQLRLNGGKGTPYDFDTHVPLVVTGPGVQHGVRHQWISNIDLAPTFERLAGLEPPSSIAGTSFADSLGEPAARGNHYVFYDHTYAKIQPGEVDSDKSSGGDIESIPSYVAVRGKQGLLARFDLDNSWRGHRYAYELYSYRDDAFERTNVFARDHAEPWARALRQRLDLWAGCQPARCREAAR